MIAVHVPWQMILLFQLKKTFLLFVTPVLVGFLVSVLFPLAQRAAAQHRSFLRVTFMAAAGPTFMLFGWMLVVRTIWTAPMYGLGYGLGVALMSRVHSVRLWPPKIVTRREAARAMRLSEIARGVPPAGRSVSVMESGAVAENQTAPAVRSIEPIA